MAAILYNVIIKRWNNGKQEFIPWHNVAGSKIGLERLVKNCHTRFGCFPKEYKGWKWIKVYEKGKGITPCVGVITIYKQYLHDISEYHKKQKAA